MDPIPLLHVLLAATSSHPSLVEGAPGEAAAAEVCRAAMQRSGLDVVVQPVRGDRSNVIGVLEGRAAGPSVMFCGHLDTVGVTGMVDPFVPRVEQGRLYGRGAQDMKGGVAAMIAAASVLAKDWSRGRFIVAGVVDEEHEASAPKRSCASGVLTPPSSPSRPICRWPSRTRASRGLTSRRAAAPRSSRPAEGRDAILRMGRVLQALERLDRDVQARPPAALVGTASLHASIIAGGLELSSYPDRCRLQMERRAVSGETAETVTREVDDLLAAPWRPRIGIRCVRAPGDLSPRVSARPVAPARRNRSSGALGGGPPERALGHVVLDRCRHPWRGRDSDRAVWSRRRRPAQPDRVRERRGRLRVPGCAG